MGLLSKVLFYVGYIGFGGIVFHVLEYTHEQDQCARANATLAQFYTRMECIIDGTCPDNKEQQLQDIKTRLKDLQKFRNIGIHITDEVTCGYNWYFNHVFFFSMTVVTTIGYGHTAPVTKAGQAFCIAYSVVGMCLFGLMVSALGALMRNSVLTLCERGLKWCLSDEHTSRSIWISVSVFATGGFVVFALIPSTIFMFVEDWTFFEAFYYCVITLTTIGFGDYTPDYTSTNHFVNTLYRLASMIWIIFGLAYFSGVVTWVQERLRQQSHFYTVRSALGQADFTGSFIPFATLARANENGNVGGNHLNSAQIDEVRH